LLLLLSLEILTVLQTIKRSKEATDTFSLEEVDRIAEKYHVKLDG
jgi:hypothetical protein